MQTGVSSTHNVNQKKLNGRPKMMGCIRSHSDTEKQDAAKGIKAKAIAPVDGRFMQEAPAERFAGLYQECMTTRPAASELRKRLVEIGDDVLDILDADRNPDHAIGNSKGSSSLFAQTRVSH